MIIKFRFFMYLSGFQHLFYDSQKKSFIIAYFSSVRGLKEQEKANIPHHKA